MAGDVVIYVVVHQPRRLKLPAQPMPPGATAADLARCLFDERLNQRYFHQVAERCYRPATALFAELVDDGLRLNVGFSESFLFQAERWGPEVLTAFQRLVAHPHVEPVGVEPYHSFLPLVDLERFVARMREARTRLARVFGVAPRVADTTELCMSDPIALALEAAGYAAGFLEGRPWVLGWREPTFVYHGGRRLRLLVRHHRLSDDVGYRFSDRSWPGWPLRADTYAEWLAATPGDLVVLGWDYETFGEHHRAESGIFEFLRHLPREAHRRGLRFLTVSEALEAHRGRSHHLGLPAFPASWAGSGGLEFFLGNPVQQAVFQLMLHAYNKARLTGDAALVDLALWLLQSDHLHLVQWFGRSGPEAEVSAYFTPREWWALGPEGIVGHLVAVYQNFIRALAPGFEPVPPADPDPEVVALLPARRRRGGREEAA
jgi:alpha-amylase